MQEGGVAAASYQCPKVGENGEGMSTAPMPAGARAGAAMGVPLGIPVGAPTTMPTNFMPGVNAPQYGMPMCGTPIGLPGPPSVPLGFLPACRTRHEEPHVCPPAPADREGADRREGDAGLHLSETG